MPENTRGIGAETGRKQDTHGEPETITAMTMIITAAVASQRMPENLAARMVTKKVTMVKARKRDTEIPAAATKARNHRTVLHHHHQAMERWRRPEIPYSRC
jgi:ribosomal protein L39E